MNSKEITVVDSKGRRVPAVLSRKPVPDRVMDEKARRKALARQFKQELVVSIGAIPFGDDRREVSVAVGQTVREILGPKMDLKNHELIVIHRDQLIVEDDWDSYKPDSEYPLYVNVVPAGGLGSILSLGLSLALSFVAPGIGGFLGAQFGLGAFATRILTGAIFTIGRMILSRVFAPDPPQPAQIERDPQRFGIGSISNTFPGRRDNVLCVMGTHRLAPYLACKPYAYVVDSTVLGFRALYDFGYGPIEFDQSNFKFGDTLVSSFTKTQGDTEVPSVVIQTHEGAPGTDSVISGFDERHNQQQLSKELTKENGWSVHAYVEGVVRIDLIVQFQALLELSDSGEKQDRTVQVEVQKKEEGQSEFSVVSTYDFTGQTTSQHFNAISFPVANTGGEFRIRRNTDDNTGEDYNSRIQDRSYLVAIDQVTPGHPVTVQGRALVFLDLTASEDLNSTVQAFNAVVTRRIPVYVDGTGWTAPMAGMSASNPAWLAASILRGPGIAEPVADDLIDHYALLDLSRHCVTREYQFNGVFNSSNSVWDNYSVILSAGRAAPSLVNGSTYSLVIDREKSVPSDLITPRDSLRFSGQKAFSRVPDALRAIYNDRNNDYRESEIVVYDSGKNAQNSTDIRTIDVSSLGITSAAEVHKYLRYSIAEAKLRPELFSVVEDIKNLRIRRGDYVDLVHDVPLLGLGQGRIVRMYEESGQWVGFDLDEFIQLQGDTGSGYSVRFQDLDGNAVIQRVASGREARTIPEQEFSGTSRGSLS